METVAEIPEVKTKKRRTSPSKPSKEKQMLKINTQIKKTEETLVDLKNKLAALLE